MTRIGLGYGNDPNAFDAGKSITESALRNGALSSADLVVAFCAGPLDHEAFLSGVRTKLGPEVPVIGGSTIGVITNEYLSYSGFPAALAILQSDTWRFGVASCGGMDKDEASTGRGLIRAIPRSDADRVLLTFYDSVRVPATANTPPVLNTSALLLAGLEKELAGEIPILGAGLLGDYGFGPTKQFCGVRVEEQHAVGCIVSGPLSIYHTIMHGCVPFDGLYRKITSMEGSILYEIDGRPVIQLIDELYGSKDWQSDHPVNYLTIGVNCGERYGIPQENCYVNRLITGVTPDGRGVGMFESDLASGTEIQFMLRDNRTMLRSVKENSAALLQRVAADGKLPVFGLYIDCAGRTAEYSLTEQEEAFEVQKIMSHYSVPLLGFYSGVEIAPLLNRSRGLDWTGVLVLFAEDR